jgi:hypothetical protein
MEIADWKSSLELVGTIGLIAGLVLVAIQIHQNSVLVRAELSSNRHDAWIEIDSAKRSDNFSRVLSKAIEDPVNLSLADMIAMEGYLLNFLAQLDREYVLAELKSFQSDPNKTVKENVELYMGNQFAQAWWSVQKSDKLWSNQMIEAIDSELGKLSVTRDAEYYESIKSRMVADSRP